MKLKRIFYLLIGIMVMFSCSMDELSYSCDKETDAWVKANLSDIALMSRADWVKVEDIGYQRAIFSAFSPQQRQTLWEGKLNEALNTVKWSKNESKHIESLLAMVTGNLNIFENNAKSEEKDNVEIFLYKWIEYAVDKLEWPHELLYSLIGTPESITADRNIAVKTPVSKIRLKNGGETTTPDCDCNSTNPISGSDASSGNWIPCMVGFHICNSTTGCQVISWGCGSFWLYQCNATCQSN